MVLNNNDSLIINRGGFRSMSKLTLKQIQTKKMILKVNITRVGDNQRNGGE